MKCVILASGKVVKRLDTDRETLQPDMQQTKRQGGGRRDLVLGIALFFLALLPRVFGLGHFLTPDENLWIGRAAGFIDALSRGDLAGTFQVGHPGVTTRWTAGIAMLLQYLPGVAWKQGQFWLGQQPITEIPDHLMDVLVATRLPTVLLFSGLVVAVYFLARRLVGSETALLGAVLLAFDPFGLAISRVIHHDALCTVFMTVSVLAFAAWLPGTQRRWLVVSGAAAGLACLSKATAVFLGPAVLLIGFGYPVSRRFAIPWKRLILGLLLWGIIAAVVFVVLWPAMWVDPVGTVRGVIEKATGYAASPHERDNFFMGQLQPDPGPLFYPLATAFRLTPVTLTGLLLSVVALWQGLRRRAEASEHDHALWLLAFWGYVVLFTAMMSVGAKKFDRYLLPVFPFLDLLAAAGWLVVVRWVVGRVGALHARTASGKRSSVFGIRPALAGTVFVPALVGLLALQALSSLPAYPYYLTAYNPLLGGIRQAARVLLVGWGEGYDQVANYLNAQPDAENLNVATWYAEQTMTYLFDGHSWDVRANRQEPIGIFPWTQADYMVVYINQFQREIPDRAVLDFFQSLEPEHVVNLGGLDYAWLYRVPEEIPRDVSPYQYPVEKDFSGKVRLLGYDVDEGLTEFEGEHYLVITFYWQCLEPMTENYRLYLKLVNGVYHIWGAQDSYPIWDGFMTAEWQPGTIIRDVHGIAVDAGTPAGSYQVTVDWLQPYTQHALIPDGGSFVTGPVSIPALPVESLESLDIQHRVDLDFAGKVRLLGYNLEGRYRPAGNVHLVLFWQVLDDVEQDYTVFNHLVSADGALAGQKDNAPVDGFYPTSLWRAGAIIRDQYDIALAADAPVGRYRIETGLYAVESGARLSTNGPDGDKVVLGEIAVRAD